MTTRWKDDPQKVVAVRASVEQTYSGPWGLKASSLDVVRDAGDALGLDLAADALDAVADDLWDWECEQPSPFTEGLASLVSDGLAPGSVVPVAEIAGDSETADWERSDLHPSVEVESELVEYDVCAVCNRDPSDCRCGK